MTETFVNITKSKTLIPSLKMLLIGLNQLNTQDLNLKKLARNIFLVVQVPDHVSAQKLNNDIEEIGEVVKSYNINPAKSVDSAIEALPHVLFEIKQELDNLIASKHIEDNKKDLLNQTTASIDKFYRMVFGK